MRSTHPGYPDTFQISVQGAPPAPQGGGSSRSSAPGAQYAEPVSRPDTLTARARVHRQARVVCEICGNPQHHVVRSDI